MWHTHPRRCVFDRSHFLKNSQTKTHFVTQALVQLWLLQTVEAAVQLSEKLQGHIVNACLFNYTLSLYGHLKGSVDHSTFTQTLTMDFLLCSPPPPATVSVLPPPIGCLELRVMQHSWSCSAGIQTCPRPWLLACASIYCVCLWLQGRWCNNAGSVLLLLLI